MKAKRVHGPTPNTELLTRVKCETCDRCNNPPLRTVSVDGVIKRTCAHHVRFPGSTKQAEIRDRGWRPPWMGS